jgi:hypothetical protein
MNEYLIKEKKDFPILNRFISLFTIIIYASFKINIPIHPYSNISTNNKLLLYHKKNDFRASKAKIVDNDNIFYPFELYKYYAPNLSNQHVNVNKFYVFLPIFNFNKSKLLFLEINLRM